MADDVQTTAAESSPAAPTEATPQPEIPRDGKAYAEWRQTGKLPGDKSSEADDSAPSETSAGEKPGKAAPASEAGKEKRQARSDADSRKEELGREIRELLAKRDALRKELEPEKQDVKPKAVESSPTVPGELKRPVKPNADDYKTWEEFDAAKDEYLENLADYKAAVKLEEHTQRQRQETATQEMQRRLDEAEKRYGKAATETITGTATTIFSDDKVAPALKTAIGRSEVLVDSLYVMGSDADELSEFLDLAKKDPLEALRKWFTVEALVRQELKSGRGSEEPADRQATPPRGTDGRFLPEKPARREAPSPRPEVNGNVAPPGDERERAAKAGDFRSFKADADRRDLARARGQ